MCVSEWNLTYKLWYTICRDILHTWKMENKQHSSLRNKKTDYTKVRELSGYLYQTDSRLWLFFERRDILIPNQFIIRSNNIY